MKVKYLRDVHAPESQAGTKGETKDVTDHIGNILLKGGYVKKVETSKNVTKQRANLKSRRSKK